jgi:pectin methylesterase-like acyl-CoA thioesterase
VNKKHQKELYYIYLYKLFKKLFMKKKLRKIVSGLFIPVAMFAFMQHIIAAEALLVDENFQSWTAFTASTGTPGKTIDLQTTLLEDYSITVDNCDILPLNEAKGTDCSAGAIRFNKTTERAGSTTSPYTTSSIVTTEFASITRVVFAGYVTGSNRGYDLYAKGDGDADWVLVGSNHAVLTTGSPESVTVNRTNVALKWVNYAPAQNYFITDLKIYGDAGSAAIPPTVNSYSPESNSYIPVAGAITVTFSETVTRNTGDITFGSITIPEGNISISGSVVTINYSGLNTDDSYILTIPAGAFKNTDGTATTAATTIPYKTTDTVKPTITKISYLDGATIPESGIITLLLSETIAAGTINATIGTKSITVAPVVGKNLATISYSGLNYGEPVTLIIPEAALKDVYGNTLDKEYSYTYTVEEDTKGNEILAFSNPSIADYGTTGTVSKNIDGIDVTFDIATVATSRGSEGMAIKCNSVTFAEMANVGFFQFRIQNGSGSDTKEFYVEKFVGGSWQRVEAFILAGNGTQTCLSVNAKSSDPVTLRITGETQFWLYTISVSDFKDNSAGDDGLPPYLIGTTTPEDNATDVAINGTIKLKFNESVTLGAGDITLNGKILTPTITGASVTLPYTNLKYETLYALTIPAGAIKDKFNTDCEEITLSFTTKTKPTVTPKLFDKVVAKDGSGDYTDIQAAFDAVPAGNATLFRIFVKNGEYDYGTGRLTLAAGKNNVSLIGQSKEGVIIKGSNYVGNADAGNPGTDNCAVIDILSDDFYGENFTVINTAGVAQTERAVCIRTKGDRVAMNNVSLQGGQDILYTHTTTGRQYYKNSKFSGTVDYIFGGGDVLFDDCEQFVVARKGADATKPCVITAPSTVNTLEWGYVFLNNTINGDSSQDGVYQLGRPWQNSPRSVWINTTMNVIPVAAGWGDMQVAPALFAEYNSLKGNGTAVDVSQRKTMYYNDGTFVGENTKTTLTESEAAEYTPENIFGLWNAVELTEATAAPTNLVLNGNTLNWDAVDGATCYVILHGDNVIGFSITNTFTDASIVEDATPYYVMAVAEFGALSLLSDASTTGTGFKPAVSNKDFLKSTLVKDEIQLLNVDEITKVTIYDFGFRKVFSTKVSASSISVSSLPVGVYFVMGETKTGERMIAKIVKQ